MKMVLINAAAFGLFVTSSTGALAQSLEWRVSESAGPVTVWNGGQKRSATRGELLKPGEAVQAGPGARAVLVHDRDFVTVAANSRVTVPTPDKATGFVRLLQDWGNAVFRIEKLGKPHFGVNTPSLAAVVKGTTFSITVDRSGTSLQVTEGVVEVATLDGGARDLIRAGGVANISAADPMRLNIRGEAARAVDSPARSQTGASAESPAPALASNLAPVQTVAILEVPIASKPVDLAEVTNGLVASSSTATQVAAVLAEVRAPVPQAARTPEPQPEVTGASAPGSSTNSGPVSGKESATSAGQGGGASTDDSKASKDDAKAADDAAKAADKAAKDATKAADDAAKAANKANEDAGKAADQAAKDAQKDADKAAEDAAKAADKAAKDTQKAADDAAKAASRAAEDAAKAADQVLKDAQKAADDAAKVAAKTAEDAAKAAAKAAEDAAKAADQSGKDVQKAGDDISKAADKAAEDAAKAAEKTAKDAQKAADDAAKDAQKVADDAAKAAQKAAEDARKAAEDAAKDAKDATKGVKDVVTDGNSGPGRIHRVVDGLRNGLFQPN